MLTADSDNLAAGEEWCIVGTLLDRDGTPLDLTDLLDQSGAPGEASNTSTVLDSPTAGIVLVNLATATTAALAPGCYTDELQVTRSGRAFVIHGMSMIVVAMHPLSS